MSQLILIKYGELTTKKANRNVFINLLTKNIKNILKEYEIVIKKDRVRMYIEAPDINIAEIAKKLQKVFGIHSIVICHKVNTNINDIKTNCLDLLKKQTFDTFKVVTKRAFKEFEISSMEFNNQMGAFILDNLNVSVNVHNPDVYLNIEIRKEGTFIYTNELKGSGGYPVGVQGKGLLMLSGGIDSPVAGYLAIKKGIDIDCIYFESPPHTSIEAKNKVIKLATILNEYCANIRLHIIPFTDLQVEIYKKGADNYMITIMRRMMYKIALEVAKKNHCKCLINGESIGQVASQTLDSLAVINEVTTMPIIRPVACLDKLEIIDIATKIDTYETSILPFEDCCTIFLPNHPIINPKLEHCHHFEEQLDVDLLIKQCLTNVQTININDIKKNSLL